MDRHPKRFSQMDTGESLSSTHPPQYKILRRPLGTAAVGMGTTVSIVISQRQPVAYLTSRNLTMIEEEYLSC